MAFSNKLTIVPFNVFDATVVYPIKILDETNDTNIDSFECTIYECDGSSQWYEDYYNSISDSIISTTLTSIDDYISTQTISNIQLVKLQNNFYLIIPQNELHNGSYYHLTLSLYYVDTISHQTVAYQIEPYIFGCFTLPNVALYGYEYQKGIINSVSNPNTLTIEKSVCTLHYSYVQSENDAIKYYQFFLYDIYGRLLGTSKKIYSMNISYTVENFNNNEKYVLKLYCETQSGNKQWVNTNLIINYNQENIYTDIKFDFNNQTAINNISISITQLNGTGGGYTFKPDSEDGEIIITDNGQVNFTDSYNVIKNNFLCRVWCSNLTPNSSVFTMRVIDTTEYIDIYFTGTKFYAIKYSNGLKTSYISNELELPQSGLQDVQIYLAIGYYKGRIEMYTSIIS